MVAWVQASKRLPKEDGYYFWRSWEDGFGGWDYFFVIDKKFDENEIDNSFLYWLDGEYEIEMEEEDGH